MFSPHLDNVLPANRQNRFRAGFNLKEIHKQKLKGVLHPSIVRASSVSSVQAILMWAGNCYLTMHCQTFGLSKVCAQVSTKTPKLVQFCLYQKISESKVSSKLKIESPWPWCLLAQWDGEEVVNNSSYFIYVERFLYNININKCSKK